MDKAILLTKLSQCEDETNFLYLSYLDATQTEFESETKKFETLISELKTLSELQYNFNELSTKAQEFGISRRDYRELCDMVCIIIGDSITELCKYTKDGIVTVPTKFEDYCPFYSTSLVVYGSNIHDTVKYEGKIYKVLDTKLEQSQYYSIYCSTLDF